MRSQTLGCVIAATLATLVSPYFAYSEEKPVSPYIDQIRREMDERDRAKRDNSEPTDSSNTVDPYLQSVRKKLDREKPQSETSSESYTEQQKKLLAAPKNPTGSESYSDQEKAKLAPESNPSAIQAVKEGKSELHARRSGEIHNAAGIRIGPSLTHDVTASTGLRPFNDIYGSNAQPDVELFYEYQPWHSEWYGNLGIFGQTGVGYAHGKGVFQFPVANPSANTKDTSSSTTFQFFTVPVTVGLNYRFNLFRYLRPFVMAGPSEIIFYEGRSDGQDGHTARSTGFLATGGVSILMDWISGQSSQDLYSSNGIKHYYLSIDYSRLSTFSGDVRVTVSGIYAGFTFEF
jgi:hypothetical protein